MEKISNVFKKGKGPDYIYKCWNPDLEMTKKIIHTPDQAGNIHRARDSLFRSLADGPVIQAASQRALENGVTLLLILETVKEMKPLIRGTNSFMGYYNNIISYGQERFVKDVKEAGGQRAYCPRFAL